MVAARVLAVAALLLVGLTGSTLSATADPARPASTPTAELEPSLDDGFQASLPALRNAPALPPGGISTRGSDLLLFGRARRFAGVNAPDAASTAMLGFGCGTDVDLDLMFNSLGPDPFVRVWFTQGLAIDHATGQRDWRGIDRVVAAAERSIQRPHLIVTLATQSGDCDTGTWRGQGWYEGGWRTSPEAGLPTTYEQFVREIVSRYASSPAIAMWEPVNEPEASDCLPGHQGSGCYGNLTCGSGAAASLQRFFDGVGGIIKSIDPLHLVSSGSIGGDQCGWAGNSWLANASSYIDVLNVHEYGLEIDTTEPLKARIDQAHALGKPLIVGEVGVSGGTAPGCRSLAERSWILTAKMRARLDAGLRAFLVWQWGAWETDGCEYYLAPDEPFLVELRGPVVQSFLQAAPVGSP